MKSSAIVLFISFYCLCAAKLFYVYDWPDITNRYSKVKAEHNYDPNFIQHGGAGLAVNETRGLYSTWQFALFKITYERALKDHRRTLDPALATTFLIPYDIGLDACFRQDNGKMRKMNCPMAAAVSARLHSSIYFNASHGHDHLLVVSVNQNMNYFLGARQCQSFLSGICYNCTKLAIDEYSFLHSINRYEAALSRRGDFWHAVPFPANSHFSSMVKQPFTWSTNFEPRQVLVSYTGSKHSYNHVSSRFRSAIISNCEAYFNVTRPDGLTVCSSGKYSSHPGHGVLPLAGRSIFCFQPTGDMPTRKSVFDAILLGCIPVFFSKLTAPLMYEWHWSMDLWEDVSVSFHDFAKQIYSSWADNAPISDRVDMVKILSDLYDQHRALIRAKQKLIEQFAFRLQYSLPESDAGENRVETAHVSQARRSLMTNPDKQGQSFPVNLFLNYSVLELNHLNWRELVGSPLNDTSNRSRNLPLPAEFLVPGGRYKHVGDESNRLDAYDVSMSFVLAIHSGKYVHNRTSHYMVCEDKESFVVDWCTSTNSSIDIRVDW